MIVRMSLWGGLAAGFLLASCAVLPDTEAAPTPQAAPVAPYELTGEERRDWREVDPEDLLLIETRHGVTAVELNTSFAPNHATRLRELARAGAYDGEYFYRVIDGFVAQGGVKDDERMTGWPTLKNENDRLRSFETYIPLGNGDLFTRDVGHSATGFAMARDEEMGREWLLHCPGAMAMARDADPDSGGTEFYIVLDAQRYLDRNLTIFGRVVDGMEHVQALERGDRAIENGVIQAPRTGDEIIRMRIAADLPEAERPRYLVMRGDSSAFEDAKREKRVRDDPFFYRKPPEVLDICSFEVPVRKVG